MLTVQFFYKFFVICLKVGSILAFFCTFGAVLLVITNKLERKDRKKIACLALLFSMVCVASDKGARYMNITNTNKDDVKYQMYTKYEIDLPAKTAESIVAKSKLGKNFVCKTRDGRFLVFKMVQKTGVISEKITYDVKVERGE